MGWGHSRHYLLILTSRPRNRKYSRACHGRSRGYILQDPCKALRVKGLLRQVWFVDVARADRQRRDDAEIGNYEVSKSRYIRMLNPSYSLRKHISLLWNYGEAARQRYASSDSKVIEYSSLSICISEIWLWLAQLFGELASLRHNSYITHKNCLIILNSLFFVPKLISGFPWTPSNKKFRDRPLDCVSQSHRSNHNFHRETPPITSISLLQRFLIRQLDTFHANMAPALIQRYIYYKYALLLVF